MANFDVELNDEVENFTVEFGEIQRITVDDFDKLRNRPSYAGQTMTHETNIPAVPSKVSQLENDADYQTGEDVQEAIAGKQDALTAGNNIQISEQNVISATDTTYSAGSGINISNQNAISVDTTIVATQQGLSDEVTNRENADIYLQGQIDAISASSDVVDIVGTYADLQNYDTSKLKDNDIIKVLQDETQGNATTYYRWSTHTETFTLIGQEGPYYTKAGADAQFVPQTRTVNGKALSANITLNASDVSALGTSDVSQTTGSSTSMVMSQKATTDALGTKLNIADYVVDTQLADSDNPVQNRVLNGLLGDMPSDFFSGSDTATPTASTEVQFGNILNLDDVQLLGDTYQQTYSGKNLWNAVIEVGGWSASGGSIANTARARSRTKVAVQPNTEYTLSMVPRDADKTINMTVQGWTADNTFIKQITGLNWVSVPVTFTTPDNCTQITISGRYSDDISFGTLYSETDVFQNIQLETGSQATSYEPYVGGIPAPNPGYPETVNVVTGVQSVLVHGKNLFNVDATLENRYLNADGGWTAGAYSFVNQEYNVGNNTALTVSFTSRVGSSYVRVGMYKADGSFIERALVSTNSTVSLSAGTSKIVTSVDNASSAKFNDLQIEFGSSASFYEPYQGATYTIDLGATELCKIGTYQDKIYKSGGDWYLHKEVGNITFDGSESWSIANTGTANFYYMAQNLGLGLTSNTQNLFSNYGTPALISINNTVNGIIIVAADNNVLRIRYGEEMSLADWQTKLSTTNMIVKYALATPTDTKITDATLISELEAVLNASTYDGETDIEITATGTNLPAPLLLTAVNANVKGIIERLRA